MQRTLFNLMETTLVNESPTVSQSFAEWLKEYHSGKENAVTAKKMSQWGSGVDIRSMVHDLRIQGFPICSDNDGYYYATTADELDATINIMRSRAKEIEKVFVALNKTKFKMTLPS